MAVTKERELGAVAVLDAGPDKELTALLRHAGLETRTYVTVEGLRVALASADHLAAAIAFEAVLPDAQRTLRELTDANPGARIALMYREAGDRPRILDRLWAAGACHFVVSRATPAPKLRALFHQAIIEARFERMSAGHGETTIDADRAVHLVRFLQRLTIALAGQPSSRGLLRELSTRLPQVIDCSMFGVLLLESPPKLVTFQAAAMNDNVIWDLAERSCTAIAPFVSGSPPLAGELEFLLGPSIPSPAEPAGEDAPHEIQAWPMVVSGEAVGSLGIVFRADDTRRSDHVYALQLVASQLATALRHVQLISELEARAQLDPLTGLHNRQYMPGLLEREWRRAQRYSLHLTTALIDVDGFQRVNQLHGPFAADTVLKDFADLLAQHTRGSDHLLSYGADRFLLVLTETGASGAAVVIERVRVALKTKPLQVGGNPIGFSFSAGIASHPTNRVEAAVQLLALAEHALAGAKQDGGDRTHVAEAPKSTGTSPGDPSDRRIKPRVTLEVPTTFLPLPDLDPSRVLRLPSINLSADGIALRDPTRTLKRKTHGLVFFDDRPEPMLCKVVWVRSGDGEYRAGLEAIRASQLLVGSERGSRRSRRALVAVHDEARLVTIRRVLRSARFDVRVLALDAEHVDEGLFRGASLVVMSSSVLSRPIGQQFLRYRGGAGSAVRLIVLNEALEREQAIGVISEHRVEHLISGEESQAELLFTTLTKLGQPDFFGARRYLLPGADCKRWTVTDSTEKSYALAGVRTVAEEVACHPRVTDLLVSAVDEMIIYMLFGAQADLATGGMKPISVECGADGRFLCVSVLDENGRLRTDEVYADLAAAAERRSLGVVEHAGTSRLGFRIMLDALSQISINVEPGMRTEIIGLVDLRRSLREHRASAPSVGVFGPE